MEREGAFGLPFQLDKAYHSGRRIRNATVAGPRGYPTSSLNPFARNFTMRHPSIRKLAVLAASLTYAIVATHSAAAQIKPASGFGLGYTDIGPALGLGGIGGASASFGGRFERAIKPLPELGNGMVGIEASFDYYSWSTPSYSWKYIPIGVTANYHFKMTEPKIDPFVGLGLGYRVITCDFAGLGGSLCSNSAIYFIGRAGARYFFNPKMAAYGDVGAGAATLNVGLMFKLN
jgi:hypothetical protein